MSATRPDARLLGPVQLLHHGRPVPLGHARQRAVMAVLLLHANRVVSTDSLTQKVWGPDAPDGARSSLYSYITRLRSTLTGAEHAAVTIQRASGGYVLSIDDRCVDEQRVRACIAAARESDDPQISASLLREARLSWSGSPLKDVDSPWLADVRRELQELWAATLLEEQAALERTGRPAELLPQLERLAARRPLDESVVCAIMRALASTGRRAEALKRFEALRVALREELGTSPDATTTRHYRDLLGTAARQPSPDKPKPTGAGGPPTVKPAQLPSDVAGFSGRVARADELSALLGGAAGPDAAAQPGALPRLLLHGPAGIGKTALGLHVCHRLLAHFPDGQIYLNLSGYRPGHAPLAPGAGLARCLRALGVQPADVPADQEEAASLLRSLLSGKRALLFLDDARDIGQVLPLLPGDRLTGVIVTSRHRLPELVTHGVRNIELDTLRPSESLDLLRRVIGAPRIAAEPAAAAELGELCSHLPLALRLLAARAADRPLEPLKHLARSLRSAATPFPLLVAEPGIPSPVETAFALSYEALTPRLQTLFRALACLPGADFSAETAVVAVDQPIHELSAALYHLRAVHLLEEPLPGRFRFHDLIRLYGQQCASQQDDPQSHADTLRRVAHYYRHGTEQVNAHHRLHFLRPPGTATMSGPPGGLIPAGAAETGTLAWLEMEHSNILSTIHQAAAHGMHEPAWRLADAMRGFYRLRPHEPDWLQAALDGLSAAEATGDPVAVAALHLALADIHQADSSILKSLDHDTRARLAARAARWLEGEAAAASGLGRTQWSLGSLDAARESLLDALRLYQEAGNIPGVATTLGSIGRVYHDQGEWSSAQEAYRRSLAMSRKSGSRTGQALNLYYLGALRFERGCAEVAVSHLRMAQELSRGSKLHQGDALATGYLAFAYAVLGRHESARVELSSADELAAHVTDRRIVAEVLTHTGNTQRYLGEPAAALHQHTRALEAAHLANYPRGEVLALAAIARDHASGGAWDDAEHNAALAVEKAAASHLPLHHLRATLALAETQALRQPVSERGESAFVKQTLHLCREARLHMEVGLAERLLDRG